MENIIFILNLVSAAQVYLADALAHRDEDEQHDYMKHMEDLTEIAHQAFYRKSRSLN